MIIYKDPITDDEIISDSYDLKEVGGVAYEADCRKITIGGESFDTGANASTEEAEEGVDDNTETVIDVVHSFRLRDFPFDKKQYLGAFKTYLKKVTQKLKDDGASEDEIKKFQTGVQAFAKDKIIPNFKDYEFFVGENYDPETGGLVVLLNYREDGITPYVTIFKHGLTEMKV